VKILVAVAPGGKLSLNSPGAPPVPMTQVKGLVFRTPQFSDVTFEFVLQNGNVIAMKQKTPGAEFSFPKK
jgi:hypothetical protein